MMAAPRGSMHVARASAVVLQRVPRHLEDRFLESEVALTQIAENFVGYCGTDVFPPSDETGGAWVVLIHFEDQPTLEQWLGSPERSRLIEEMRANVGGFELKTLQGGFGPWFAGLESKSRNTPDAWKMALTVLLALFPTVMLLTIFVGPLLDPLGFSISMLIGNALSISILQWILIPRISRVLAPWLESTTGGSEVRRRATPIAIVAILAILAYLFRQIKG